MFLSVIALLLGLGGCDDSNAYVTLYDRNLTQRTIPCMRLKVFPADPAAEKSMKELYAFTPNCPYTLELSTKAGIHCNSNANVPQKVTSNFPSAYLRLELRKGMKLLYSYYVDLTHRPGAGDIESGFKRLRDDLKLEK